MDFSYVPTLQHMSCVKIVTSLFNSAIFSKTVIDICSLKRTIRFIYTRQLHPTLRKFRSEEYNNIRRVFTEDLRTLTRSEPLRRVIERYFAPLFGELEKQLQNFNGCLLVDDDSYFVMVDNIPRCWLTDGTIHQEKLMKSVVRSNYAHIINRFTIACDFCLYEDVLNLWKLLSRSEKSQLRQNCAEFEVKLWIIWLERDSHGDWDSCVAWLLGTSMWRKNASAMKHVLLGLTPYQRSYYLLGSDGLNGKKYDRDVMRFGLSMLTPKEQESVFQESPVKVFKCASSWPVRTYFWDALEDLSPFLPKKSVCNLPYVLFLQMRNEWYPQDFIEILKIFWADNSEKFDNIKKDDSFLDEAIHFILDHDMAKILSNMKFLKRNEINRLSDDIFLKT